MRAVALAFLLMMMSVAALAQVGLPFPGPGTVHGGAAAYTGPGDCTNCPGTATAWWGLRAYDVGHADGAHKSISLSRSSDSHTCDIFMDTSGALGNTTNCSTGGDNTTAVATWCNATTCSITKWFDQTGNSRDITTSGTSAVLEFSPVQARWNNSATTGDYCTASNVDADTTQPNSMSAVFSRHNSGSTFEAVTAYNNGAQQWGGTNLGTADTLFMYDGTVASQASITDDTFHAAQVVFNGASSDLYIDGTGHTLNPGASAGSPAKLCVGGNGGGNIFIGLIREAGFWDGVTFTSNNKVALNGNQHTFWSF